MTTRRSLYDAVWSEPLGAVAVRHGLTGNGLAKLCDRLRIPRPPRSYWTRRPEDRPAPDPLGPAPDGGSETVSFTGERSPTRRKRTRLSLLDRQQQLMRHAAAIALSGGVQEVTLKRVAREAGISETQAHNCFAGRTDLLVALARQEIAAVEAKRRERVERGGSYLARVVMSTISYLHEAAERGALLQLLLRHAEVRDALRAERYRAAAVAREPILEVLAHQGGMSREAANGSTAALTAVCLRAGGLIAASRCDFETAERLCVSIVMAGTISNRRTADSLR